MTDFQSYSQCGQDEFCYSLLGPNGTFLDIGASHPTALSNTYGLEQVGWSGHLIEIEHTLCEQLRAQRKATVIEADATQLPWSDWWSVMPCYLSLDVDEMTLEVLRKIPLSKIRFRVITIEHDAYRFGDKLRIPERELLTAAGYVLVRPDVANKETPDMPFEDWWTCPELADKARSLP